MDDDKLMETFTTLTPVVMASYPRGIYDDHNHFPLLRTGYIATIRDFVTKVNLRVLLIFQTSKSIVALQYFTLANRWNTVKNAKLIYAVDSLLVCLVYTMKDMTHSRQKRGLVAFLSSKFNLINS